MARRWVVMCKKEWKMFCVRCGQVFSATRKYMTLNSIGYRLNELSSYTSAFKNLCRQLYRFVDGVKAILVTVADVKNDTLL